MKIIKYNLYSVINHGTEEEPQIEETLYPVTMPWDEVNEMIAKQEAYKGEYIIEDDGEPDPAEIPSQLDLIEAQITYTAMMTDTLLEG